MFNFLKKDENKEKAKKRRSEFKKTKQIPTLIIDENSKQFKLASDYYKVFAYSELENYELLIDDSSIITGGLSVGRAVVGNTLLGPAGLIVGALTGKKKVKKMVDKITIKFTVSGLHEGTYNIEFISSPVEYDSPKYNLKIEDTEKVLAFFDQINS